MAGVGVLSETDRDGDVIGYGGGGGGREVVPGSGGGAGVVVCPGTWVVKEYVHEETGSGIISVERVVQGVFVGG